MTQNIIFLVTGRADPLWAETGRNNIFLFYTVIKVIVSWCYWIKSHMQAWCISVACFIISGNTKGMMHYTANKSPLFSAVINATVSSISEFYSATWLMRIQIYSNFTSYSPLPCCWKENFLSSRSHWTSNCYSQRNVELENLLL